MCMLHTLTAKRNFGLHRRWFLANHTGLSATQIRQAQAVVNAHFKEIQDAWNHHFGG